MGVSWGSGMLAGKLAGYCSKLFGTNCWADQTAFAAAGDECDEFEVKPSSKMIETELEGLLATDEATRADMAVALRKLQGEIAERIKIEGSLRESEARFRALLRAASDGIHVLDKNGNVVEVNDAFCRMLGYTREELLQLNVRDWDAQWSPEELAAKCNELITGSDVFETRHRRKDGTVLEVEVGGVGMTLDNRRLICASARDITDRKRAEELLRENDERYQALIRTSMDGFWICNPEGRLLDVNDAYCAMSGYPREELLSKSISNLDCTESPEQVRQHLCQIVVRGFDRYETQHCRRDGRLIDVEVSSVYLAARGVFLDFIHDITERKRAEKALRESEERYRLLAENVSDVIWILDLETSRFRYVSPSVERLRGFTAEEALTQDMLAAHTPSSARYVAQVLPIRITAFSQGCPGPYVDEIEQPRRDGTAVWTEVTSHYRINKDNGHLEVYGVSRDISERKRSEQALIEGEKLLRETQEMAGLGTYVLDFSTGVWTSSAVLNDIFGINEDFPRSVEGWISLVHPEWRRQLRAYFTDEVLGKHIRFDKEYKIVRRSDGAERWVYGIGELELDERGRPVRMIGTIRDITGQKQAEESLRLSEEKFRSMAEQLTDVLFATDSAGVFTYLSPAASGVFGWRPEEMVGREFSDCFSEGEIPKALEALKGAVAMNRQVQDLALTMKRKDGSLFRGEVTSSPILTRGVVTGTLGLIRDVTDRLATEEQLRHAQKMESVGRLAGGIAHDFNNLLTVINGYSDVMLRSLNKADPLWNSVDEIRKAGTRAAELTRQLLVFSRRQVVEPRPVSLNGLVRESWDMLGRLVGEDIEIVAGPATEDGQVMVDPGQLHQVLMNLVVNAREAMPEGGRLTIASSRTELDEQSAASHSEGRPGSYVVLTVSDTGIGMSEETRQKIFEPFFTTKPEGTGLGLSTVYGIVRQAGGWIEVEGVVGSGAMFRIWLPRLEEPVSEDLPAAPTTSLKGTETVLVVEDQDDVRNLAMMVLKSYGYRVLGARGGGEALVIAERHPGAIDLLLTDVVMPQMTGKELAMRMKSLRPETRTLFMSGYSEEVTSRQGIEAIGNYIQKPFSPEALALKVRRVLDERPRRGRL